MQKRRAHQYLSASSEHGNGNNNGGASSLLDVPMGDPDSMTRTAPPRTHSSSRKILSALDRSFHPPQRQASRNLQRMATSTQKHSTRSNLPSLIALVMVTTIVMILVWRGYDPSTGSNPRHHGFMNTKRTLVHKKAVQAGSKKMKPFSQYRSLNYAFDHSQLVGLYFAASWCPLSTPVTENINQYLGKYMLGRNDDDDMAPISIVYVSSDNEEKDVKEYMGENWMAVPWDSNERRALKKHFSTCSKPEVESLGIDRKFEVPTLFILDGPTHGVLTSNGAEDLEEYKEKSMEHWFGLHDLVRSMEGKYAADEHETGEIMGGMTPQQKRARHAEAVGGMFD